MTSANFFSTRTVDTFATCGFNVRMRKYAQCGPRLTYLIHKNHYQFMTFKFRVLPKCSLQCVIVNEYKVINHILKDVVAFNQKPGYFKCSCYYILLLYM